MYRHFMYIQITLLFMYGTTDADKRGFIIYKSVFYRNSTDIRG